MFRLILRETAAWQRHHAEMPDVMCSLETFVTDKVLWQESLFLVTVPEHNRRQENYELF